MAIDAQESPSASPSSSHFSSPRHYYVAVDRVQFKMETLVDLLRVAGRRPRPSLPIVLCCSTRDELDAVCSTVSNLSFISLASLSPGDASCKLANLDQYSDLAEAERALILERFRQVTIEWNQTSGIHPDDGCENENQGQKYFMIVVTDACLPVVASGEMPISAHILINYELPTKKETYLRRISTCLAADGVVINMVVGGEVVTLKGIEESSGLLIAEMPINISDILRGY